MTAALLGTAAHCCCSKLRPVALLSSSSSTNSIYPLHVSVAQLGIRSLSPWNGLKRHSISFRRNHKYLVKKEKFNRMAVYASLFGVGAPEALVIGVVALLIFGPKGLAEVARNLGKTLRSFQPTIRELQEVSREFKSSFEREIGLDEVNSTINNSAYRSNSVVNESQQTVSDRNGRPVAETLEFKNNTEELSPITKFQTNSSEEQTQESKSAEATATNSAPTEESEPVSVESMAQTSALQRTESQEDVK